MRILKVILLLFLICKSSLSFSIGAELLGGSSSCCDQTEETSKDCGSDQEEEKKKCCTTVCDCLCCGHIFTFNEFIVAQIATPSIIAETTIDYTFSYRYKFSSGFWQPPRLLEV